MPELLSVEALSYWQSKIAVDSTTFEALSDQAKTMAGQYQQLWQDRDILPYWRYVAVRDDRTRPTHAAMLRGMQQVQEQVKGLKEQGNA
jgi:hypothetical protein